MANVSRRGVAAADALHEGGPRGVLLIHDLGGTPAEFAFVAAGLSRAGFTVCCPLLYGHGGSLALLGATTWRDWYRTAREAHAQIARRCGSVVVCGLGAGALLALELAIEHPGEAHGVALLAPMFWPDGWAVPWHAQALRLVPSKRLANQFRLDMTTPFGIKDDALRKAAVEAHAQKDRPSEDVLGCPGGALLEIRWLAAEVSPRLSGVTQPCLIVHAREDDRSRLATSQFLQTRLGGIVDLIVLEDSYHLVTMDRQRDMVLERLQAFAAGLPLDDPGGRPSPDMSGASAG